jgi:hypothetical protein
MRNQINIRTNEKCREDALLEILIMKLGDCPLLYEIHFEYSGISQEIAVATPM